MKVLYSLFMGIVLLLIVACSDDNNNTNQPDDVKSIIVRDLDTDTTGGRTWGYFSFRENKAISQEDSATTKWDIAFNRTNIMCNSGVRGPGNGAILLLTGVDFLSLKEAPATGYFAEEQLSPFAINKSNAERWYSYNPDTHIISPVPGVVIIVKTADGKYVKMRIISYYKGAPEKPTQESLPRYFTFEYVYQPDGSRMFE